MKKINKPYSNQIRFLNIFLEELEQIEAVLKNKFEGYKIDDDENEYDDLNDLLKNQENNIKISEINFTCYSITGKNHFELNISPNGVSIYAKPDNDEIKNIRFRIENILKNNKKSYKVLFKYVFIIPALIGIVYLIAIISDIKNREAFSQISFAFSVLFFSGWLGVAAYFDTMENNTTIYIVPKSKKPSFYKRNKDKIWVGIIVGVITAIITALIVKLLN
jgi:hypothetical protein